MKQEAQALDNELARLNIEKTKQALAGMVAGGSRGGGGRGRGRAKKEKEEKVYKDYGTKTYGKTGRTLRNVFDMMYAAEPDFNSGASNVTVQPRLAKNANTALQAIYEMDGKKYDLDTMPDDPYTYIMRNAARKSRKNFGF